MTKARFNSNKALALACLWALLAGLVFPAAGMTETGHEAGCSITLLQDMATVGQPAVARVDLPEGISRDAVTCTWAYRRGPDWEEIPATLEAGLAVFTPPDKGWLKLVVALTLPDGSSSTCTSNTMPVLFSVSPVACRVDSQPVDTGEGPGVQVQWAIEAQEAPLQVTTRWYGDGRQLEEALDPDSRFGQAIFLPEKDGKIRFVVEVTDMNDRTSTFDSGLILVHTYQNGTRRVVTNAMLRDKVKELAADSKVQAPDAYGQAKWLHDHLTRSAFYDHGYTLYDPHGVLLLGTGVCQSFALAYQQLLTAAGIPNKYVTGIGRGGNDMDFHAWNLVQIEGQWYHVDVTWDDAGGHQYFLKSDSFMKRTHSWAYDTLPEAPANYSKTPAK